MSHIVLYRKWRPQTFVDLLGQEHVNKTLTNAIKNNHIAHAYLFCGPRGTGKTTTARLIAKALNCNEGMSPYPCNNCTSCMEIKNGSSLDVIEIDAASNRGIDEIRTLREQVKFASTGGRYKVYIIDEFHMLTTEASNAFLKTLEEPPANVVFVLATTEAHKILPTIISRCQKFDFRKISTSTILNRLNQIVVSEKIPLSQQALTAIARQAQGGMRDALSLLDQAFSFSTEGESIADELVYQILGMLKEDVLLDLGKAIINSESSKVIKIINQLLDSGNEPFTIVKEVTNFFRNLLVVKNINKPTDELNISVTNLKELNELAEKFSPKEIIYCLETLNQTSDRLRRLPLSSIWLEANMVRLCLREDTGSIDEMNNKIKSLEDHINKLESIIKDGKYVKTAEPVKPVFARLEEPIPRPLSQFEPQSVDTHVELQEEDKISFALTPPSEPDIWAKALSEIGATHIPLKALLDKGKPGNIDNENKVINIHFTNSLWKEKLEKTPKDMKFIESVFSNIVGYPVRISLKIGEPERLEEFPNITIPTTPLSLKEQRTDGFDSTHQPGSVHRMVRQCSPTELTNQNKANKPILKEVKNNFNPIYDNDDFNIVNEAASIFRGKIIKKNSYKKPASS